MWRLKLLLREFRERMVMRIVWALPRRIVYWATVRLGAEVSTSEAMVGTPVPEMSFMDALKAWG